LPDPRVGRTKLYPLLEIILLVVNVAVSSFEDWISIKTFGDQTGSLDAFALATYQRFGMKLSELTICF
jgi:hypothetical protein